MKKNKTSLFYNFARWILRIFLKESIVVKVDGGLGSQIFQLALGSKIAEGKKLRVLYDLSWFYRDGKSLNKKDSRNFDLTLVFPHLDFPTSSWVRSTLYKIFHRYINEFPYQYSQNVVDVDEASYIDGYYAHWRYLEGLEKRVHLKFNSDLFFKNRDQLEEIRSAICSVSVHVRRGDYVGSVFDTLTPSYFIGAIQYFKEYFSGKVPHFFIFSNDTQWVRDNILLKINHDTLISVIDANDNANGYADFFLMSHCMNHICSNSSFSYCSAYLSLGNDKKVIIPEEWIRTEEMRNEASRALRYPGWIVMPNSGSRVVTVAED